MSDDRNHFAQSTADSPAHWPHGVRPISAEALSYLGVGNDGRLFWDGKQVEVARTVSLSFWQALFTILTIVAAFIGASAALISALVDLKVLP